MCSFDAGILFLNGILMIWQPFPCFFSAVKRMHADLSSFFWSNVRSIDANYCSAGKQKSRWIRRCFLADFDRCVEISCVSTVSSLRMVGPNFGKHCTFFEDVWQCMSSRGAAFVFFCHFCNPSCSCFCQRRWNMSGGCDCRLSLSSGSLLVFWSNVLGKRDSNLLSIAMLLLIHWHPLCRKVFAGAIYLLEASLKLTNRTMLFV